MNTLPSRSERFSRGLGTLLCFRRKLIVCLILGACAYGVATHPPVQTVERGDVGLRINQWTGKNDLFPAGSVSVIPGIHELRTFSLRDRVDQPTRNGAGFEFQSIEGLTLGVHYTVRYALDADKLAMIARMLPEDIDHEVVQPVIQGVLHETFSRHTVREIFSEKRNEIQQAITQMLQPRLAADGIVLKSITIGKIDLPRDYLNGMEKMLAAELANEQMKFTLEMKAKEVKESELRAEAEKVQREKQAEAAAQEQIIAAQAQAEAMKHILPFKEKQVRQRELEAEAEKAARIKNAQAAAEARIIEAQAEADSRRKLADAEVYRLDQVGKVSSEQMAREGVILAQSPLLIQKVMAEKLSDKVQVIIASPGTNGRFLGENLIGRLPSAEPNVTNVAHNTDEE